MYVKKYDYDVTKIAKASGIPRFVVLSDVRNGVLFPFDLRDVAIYVAKKYLDMMEARKKGGETRKTHRREAKAVHAEEAIQGHN